MTTPVTKLLVRNIPQFIYDLLHKLSERNDRSVEAEARHALKSWVGPLIQKEEASNRRQEISQRLLLLLEATTNATHGQIKLSHVAKGIGMELAEPVENWFNGITEPPFSELKKIAKYFNASSDWLRHGDGKMYEVRTVRPSENPKVTIKWLLAKDECTGDDVTSIHLIRAMNKCGDFVIVKQFGGRTLNCKTITTGIHISEVIGSGGEAALMHLFVTLELLYKVYTKKSDIDIFVQSFILPEDQFNSLVNGHIHPLEVIKMRQNVALPWWEDIWDKKMQSKNTYWDGWSSLTARISRAIEQSGMVENNLQDIRNCTHVTKSWLESE
jgi:antitoxin FitA